MTSQRSHSRHVSGPDTLEFSVTAVLRMVSSLVEFGEVGGTGRSLWKVSLLERYLVSLIPSPVKSHNHNIFGLKYSNVMIQTNTFCPRLFRDRVQGGVSR